MMDRSQGCTPATMKMVCSMSMLLTVYSLMLILLSLPVSAETTSLRLGSHPSTMGISSETVTTPARGTNSIETMYDHGRHRYLFEEETGPKRRRLESFVVVMSPSNSPLSDRDANIGRDIVERVIVDFLTTYPWPAGTEISSVGLVGVKENKFDDEFRSVQLTLGGLVYFTDTSSDIPDEDGILRLVIKGLMDQDRLLKEMQPDFAFLQSVEVLSSSAMDTTVPPTPSPTTLTGNDDTDGVAVAASRGDLYTADSDAPSIGTLVGAVVGGLAFVLLCTGFILIVTRRSRQKFRQTSSAPSRQFSLSGSSAAGSELFGISIIKDESLQSDRQYSSSYVEDDNTLDDSLKDSEVHCMQLDVGYEANREVVLTSSLDKIGKEAQYPEADYPILGISKLFAAAATLPPRMIAPGIESDAGNADDGDDFTEPGGDLLQPHDPCDELRHRQLSDDMFDDASSATGISIQPHLRPVLRQDTMESFEHQKSKYNLKKDMMISPLEAYNHPHPQDAHNYRNQPFSVLTPTDISASTLAQSQGLSTPRRNIDGAILRAPPSPKTPSTPKTIGTEEDAMEHSHEDDLDDPDPYWSNNGMLSMIGSVWGTAARVRAKESKSNNNSGIRTGANAGHARSPSSGGYQSEAETSFGADDLWDPDDMSLSTDDRSADGLFHASVENRDEQSLLHHSLRNESYKMQRLRTPPSDIPGARHNSYSSSSPSPDERTTIGDCGSNNKAMSFSKIFDRRRARAGNRSPSSSNNSNASATTTTMVATMRSPVSPTRTAKTTIDVPSNNNLASPQTVMSPRWGTMPLTQPAIFQDVSSTECAPSRDDGSRSFPSGVHRPPGQEKTRQSEESSDDDENGPILV